MTREQKYEVFRGASYDFCEAKDRLNRAVQKLEANGLKKDAETLFNMILRIEQFQNKYC